MAQQNLARLDSRLQHLQAANDASAFGNGGEPPYDGGMETRVGRLEASVEHIQSDLTDLKADVRELRKDVASIRTTDFRIMYGSFVAGILGLAAIMAHGFHWF